MDVLDVPNPPHRMFVAVYPAKDKRSLSPIRRRKTASAI
jgi:hypothetical protein